MSRIAAPGRAEGWSLGHLCYGLAVWLGESPPPLWASVSPSSEWGPSWVALPVCHPKPWPVPGFLPRFLKLLGSIGPLAHLGECWGPTMPAGEDPGRWVGSPGSALPACRPADTGSLGCEGPGGGVGGKAGRARAPLGPREGTEPGEAEDQCQALEKGSREQGSEKAKWRASAWT